jgi:hypothetical protein
MPESWDDSYQQSAVDTIIPPPPRRSPALWIAVSVIVVAGLAAFLIFRGRTSPEVISEPAPVAATEPVPRATVAAEEPVNLPPLDQTDALVRDLVRKLSSHPQVAAWLATDGLIRNFVVVVTNIAEGKTPTRFLRTLKPPAPFTVAGGPGTAEIDPRSFERYTTFAQAVDSLDPAATARLYVLLKPRMQEAAAELGTTESFDRVLQRALQLLIDTPVPGNPVRVTPVGARDYGFADASLEGLTAPQKQLLRMGPQNARVVQAKLRAIAQALREPAAPQ